MSVKRKPGAKRPAGGSHAGFGGIFQGLADLVEKLEELKEDGGELSRSGQILGDQQQVKGIYGFSVKVGLGDNQPRIEPFGNIRQDKESGRTVVQELREPVVDIFEEEDHVLVAAEMPGISPADVQIEIDGDLLTIAAVHGTKKYRKEVLLPQSFSKEQVRVAGNNGVIEIRCEKSH